MHSFEVDIRICQPKKSDAEVNITFQGWLILMLTEEECTQVLLYDTVSLLSIFIL